MAEPNTTGEPVAVQELVLPYSRLTAEELAALTKLLECDAVYVFVAVSKLSPAETGMLAVLNLADEVRAMGDEGLLPEFATARHLGDPRDALAAVTGDPS